jgi:signal transduction histidine kinase
VRSMRVRLTAVATIAVVIVLVATGIALLVMQRRLLTTRVDETLLRDNADIARTYGIGDARVIDIAGDEDAFAQIIDSEGRVLAATQNAVGQPALISLPPGRDEVRQASDFPVADEPYRAIARRAGDVVVLTATPLDDVDESVAALRLGLLIAIPVVAAVIAMLVWWLVGRTLRPVEAIRSQVANIGGTNLHERVPEPATGDEVARLAHTMNAMLDRIETSAERQQQFVADASHELRTPLARMRSELEVDLAHPETSDLAATHRSVLDEAIGMQRLVDDLLDLAREEGTGVPGRREPVDLDDLVQREAQLLRADGRLHVDISNVSAAQTIGDADELRRLVRNVADNAARHARSAVAFSVRELDGRAEIAIADDGPGISPGQREVVFERFTRVDAARTTGSGGAGLGLSIARGIVERHGGSITVDGEYTRGARFVIVLPLAP